MTQEPGSNEERSALKTIGWLSISVGAVALGIYLGRELLCLYQFKRRTPYDFYSHSGDEQQGVEYGMGI